MFGDAFLINYKAKCILSLLSGGPFFGDYITGFNNWYEVQAYNNHWF